MPLVVESRNYGMGQCYELTHPGDKIVMAGPTWEQDCADKYPDYFPDYVGTKTMEFYSTVNTNFVSYDDNANTITLQPWEYYFDTLLPDQPIKVVISVRTQPDYGGSDRAVWPGAFTVIFNDQFDEIGSMCGQTVPTYVAPTEEEEEPEEEPEEESEDEPSEPEVDAFAVACQGGSLIKPTSSISMLEFSIGDEQPSKLSLPKIRDSGSVENGDLTGLRACG